MSAAESMCGVYRHDVHKLRFRSHAAAADEYAGVPVNESVPLGADRDAALLSRPRGDPEQSVANHASPYRLSLLTGETVVEPEQIQARVDDALQELVLPGEDELERLHAVWLTSAVPAAFNESVYYPYTSLRYHVLLAAALLDNYRSGREFAELYLMATAPDTAADVGRDVSAAMASEGVTPHRTVLWTPALALHVTGEPGGRPAARLGCRPARSFADVWARLSVHPIDTDGERCWRVLDAQLRRIRSWSTALQFVEEFVATFGPESPDTGRADPGGGSRDE